MSAAPVRPKPQARAPLGASDDTKRQAWGQV